MQFAILLNLEKSYTPNANLLLAGFASLFVAVLYSLVRRKNTALRHSYHFWLFVGSGICLIALGLIFGSYVYPEPFLEESR